MDVWNRSRSTTTIYYRKPPNLGIVPSPLNPVLSGRVPFSYQAPGAFGPISSWPPPSFFGRGWMVKRRQVRSGWMAHPSKKHVSTRTILSGCPGLPHTTKKGFQTASHCDCKVRSEISVGWVDRTETFKVEIRPVVQTFIFHIRGGSR